MQISSSSWFLCNTAIWNWFAFWAEVEVLKRCILFHFDSKLFYYCICLTFHKAFWHLLSASAHTHTQVRNIDFVDIWAVVCIAICTPSNLYEFRYFLPSSGNLAKTVWFIGCGRQWTRAFFHSFFISVIYYIFNNLSRWFFPVLGNWCVTDFRDHTLAFSSFSFFVWFANIRGTYLSKWHDGNARMMVRSMLRRPHVTHVIRLAKCTLVQNINNRNDFSAAIFQRLQ